MSNYFCYLAIASVNAFAREPSLREYPTHTLNLHGESMERVYKYKYLGVVLTDDLTWSEHINQITNKARKAVGFIYRQFYNMSSKSSLLQLYNKTSSGVCITSMGPVFGQGYSETRISAKIYIKNV